MKKITLFILFLECIILPVLAQDFSAVCPTGQLLYYSIRGNDTPPAVEVSWGDCYIEGDMEIPSSVTYHDVQYDVVAIGFTCFYGQSGLTSVLIPSSVTTISDLAFVNCSGLTSIRVADGNPVYDSRDNCNAIIRTSDNRLIVGCQNTVVPNSVTSIGSEAFHGCTGLTSITIPNSVTSIGYYAFQDCSLTSIHIPSSVTSIGQDFANAFNHCHSLTSITVDSDNPVFDSRDNCNAIIKTATNKLIAGCRNTQIPNSVETIGMYAFSLDTNFLSLHIPSSVTSIDANAFVCYNYLESISVDEGNTTYDSRDNCNAIIETATNSMILCCKNTTFPSTVTSIGRQGFNRCDNLTEIVIPESITSVESICECRNLVSVFLPNSLTTMPSFQNCRRLRVVNIPESVTAIAGSTFENCGSLTEITIPEAVTYIGSRAFYNCYSLATLNIPNSVNFIGNNAFEWCSGLVSITVAEGNPTYDSRDNCNAIIQTSSDSLIFGCQNTVIPNSIKAIASWAFAEGGIETLEISNAITSIGQGAFSYNNLSSIAVSEENPVYDSRNNCNAIIETSTNKLIVGSQNTVIPDSVTQIGAYAFSGCSGLSSITLPVTVERLGSYAFAYCENLSSITSKNRVPPIALYQCELFYNVPDDIPIYVPYGTASDYAAEWSYFHNFIEIVGIEEANDVPFALYPNPTGGVVNVRFDGNDVTGNITEIQIFDVYGRLLHIVETCHGASLQTMQIDLSSYAPGVYLIQLVNNHRVVGVRKVVKQ